MGLLDAAQACAHLQLLQDTLYVWNIAWDILIFKNGCLSEMQF